MQYRSLLALLLCAPTLVFATDFSGIWTKDLRTEAEIKNKIECGKALFELKQTGDQITGSHSLATAGCGRLNEGGKGTVRGVVVGDVAVLTVISGRNGAVVLGKAKRKGNVLYWHYLDQIKPGEPENDSPLILNTTDLKLDIKL
ncbi:MAG: hypothetical protein HY253_00805 [Burkholderiales bacterium]|nr:hypothetical protein [Burkholderiales bacterium]